MLEEAAERAVAAVAAAADMAAVRRRLEGRAAALAGAAAAAEAAERVAAEEVRQRQDLAAREAVSDKSATLRIGKPVELESLWDMSHSTVKPGCSYLTAQACLARLGGERG